MEINREDLPSWDGDGDTAVEYFLEVREYGSMGEWLPFQLGGVLWRRFVPGSPIAVWYRTLSDADKEYMRSHYKNFLGFIRENWLGQD